MVDTNGSNGHPKANGQAKNLPESLGDYGGGVSADRVNLQNTRLIERAVRERWPIPEEAREAAIARQAAIATSECSTPRESAVALKTLLHAEGQNMEAEKRALQIAGLLKGADNTQPVEVNIYNDYRQACEALSSKPELLEGFYDGLTDSPPEPGSNGAAS